MWCTQATHNRFTDPGAIGHPGLSTTLQAVSSAIRANRYRSALAMLRLRRLARPGLRRPLRPRQNDRMSQRVKSRDARSRAQDMLVAENDEPECHFGTAISKGQSKYSAP